MQRTLNIVTNGSTNGWRLYWQMDKLAERWRHLWITDTLLTQPYPYPILAYPILRYSDTLSILPLCRNSRIAVSPYPYRVSVIHSQLLESLRAERGQPRTSSSSSARDVCRTTWRRGRWCSATFQRLRTGRCRSSTCSGRRSGPWEACVSQIEAGSSWLCSWQQAHSWEPADGLACSVLLMQFQ